MLQPQKNHYSILYQPTEENLNKYIVFTYCKYVIQRKEDLFKILDMVNVKFNTKITLLHVLNYILHVHYRLTHKEISKLLGIFTHVAIFKQILNIENIRKSNRSFNTFIDEILEYRKHKKK